MGKEPQAQPAPGSALVTERFLGAEAGTRQQKTQGQTSEGCTSYRLLLTPTVSVPAALGHGGPWASGDEEALSLLLRSSLGPSGCWQ